jgi:glycosyltransferase involved in cell wall biosynthesis
VHDAAALDHPEWFERKFTLWYSALLPRLIRKVRAIITVSHFSKERIVQLTGVRPERVNVIFNGVDRRFQRVDSKAVKEAINGLGLADPYILFVGSLEPRKNLKMLLETWQQGNFEGATLAVAGATGRVFQRFQIDSIPKGVRLLGRVDDDLLPALYSGAAGFVYGSIYEGFGLPPLEALACGCPVAVSDIPAHREVCGQTALYFDPFSREDLLSKLEELLRLDGAQRASMTEQGFRRAALYSWETAAAQTWRILEQEANR